MKYDHLETKKLKLTFYPNIALNKKIGVLGSIIISRIHFWISPKYWDSSKNRSNFHPHKINNEYWIYNSYKEWLKQLPFCTLRTLERKISELKKLGILKTEYNLEKISENNKQLWWTLNYNKLLEITNIDIRTYTGNHLQFCPFIADKAGLNEALFLEKIFGWQLNNQHQPFYHSYINWKKEFPFLSTKTIYRTIRELENEKYLSTSFIGNKGKIYSLTESIPPNCLPNIDKMAESIYKEETNTKIINLESKIIKIDKGRGFAMNELKSLDDARIIFENYIEGFKFPEINNKNRLQLNGIISKHFFNDQDAFTFFCKAFNSSKYLRGEIPDKLGKYFEFKFHHITDSFMNNFKRNRFFGKNGEKMNQTVLDPFLWRDEILWKHKRNKENNKNSAIINLQQNIKPVVALPVSIVDTKMNQLKKILKDARCWDNNSTLLIEGNKMTVNFGNILFPKLLKQLFHVTCNFENKAKELFNILSIQYGVSTNKNERKKQTNRI